jgi:hypothetical protein
MHPPPCWDRITQEWLGMPPREAQVFWAALARSRWSRPVQIRQQLSLIGAMRLDLVHVLLETLAPQELIGVIEDLCHERCLRRRQANRLEAYLFAQMTAEGQWR